MKVFTAENAKVAKTSNIGCAYSKCTQRSCGDACAKNEPQMNADKRRFVVPGLYKCGAGSLPAGLCQWRRAGRGLGIGERGEQEGML